MKMKQQYQWSFSKPSDTLTVHMKNIEDEQLIFNAHLQLQKRELSNKELIIITFQFPLCTIKTLVAIYWNALILKIKGIPYVEHPNPIPQEKRYAS
jgi:DUF1365 family protein